MLDTSLHSEYMTGRQAIDATESVVNGVEVGAVYSGDMNLKCCLLQKFDNVMGSVHESVRVQGSIRSKQNVKRCLYLFTNKI